MERNIEATLQCFVKKDGKYLMLHRSSDKKIMPGVCMAPGGRRETGEGLFECASREIMEETGLKIRDIRIRATGTAHLKDINRELFFHILVAEYAGGDLKQSSDGELAWLSLEEMVKLDNLLAEFKRILPEILDEKREMFSYKVIYDRGNNMIDFAIEDPGQIRNP